MRIYNFMFAILILLVSNSSAHAHLGHLGDLAGHSHWVGLGAAVAAAAIAAVLAAQKAASSAKDRVDSEDEVAANDAEADDEAAASKGA